MGEFSIQISSNLVNSLSGGEEKSKKKNRRSKTKLPQRKQIQNQNQNQNQNQIETLHKSAWAVQAPPPLPAIAELEAIRSVLQESERVVDKLQKHEEDMVQQVTLRAKELRDQEFKLPYQKALPCVAEREACFSCYKQHLNDPLKCADLVRSFADCARRIRQQVSSTQ